MKRSLMLLVIGILSALGIGGAVRSVYANQTQRPVAEIAPSPQSSTPAQDADGAGEREDDQAEGEMDDDQEEGEMDDDQGEQAASAQLQNLAKITAQQAQQTAEAAQAATANEVELDVEDGSLVYEVKFADAEVLVDAGDGQILHTEMAGQEEDNATEAPIQGSIQVPNYADDDD